MIISTKVALSHNNANSEWTSSPSTWPTSGSISATLASVRRLWPRSSMLKACMTSTASPSSGWTRPLSPSRLSRIENSAAAEAPSRAHSGELERAPHCIANHQSSPTARPPSRHGRRWALEHLRRAAMVDGEPLPVAPPWKKGGESVRKWPGITLVSSVWPETSLSRRNRQWTSSRSRGRWTWHADPAVSDSTGPSSLLFKFQISCNLAKIISSVSELQKLWNKFCDDPRDG